MDYADAIRRQVEDAPRAALPAVTALMWKAFGGGQITEAEAEALSVLIEARQASDAGRRLGQSPNPIGTACGAETAAPRKLVQASRTSVGSRPRTDASMERRRRWAASGRLPPAFAARFSLAEQATLALIAAETARRGDCRLSIPHLSAVAGVAETTVRNAIREARKLGMLTVEERRLTGFRNDTNVVRIVSPEWTAWLRLARKDDPLSKSGSSAGRKGIAHRDPLERKGEPSRYPLGGDPLREGGGCKFANRTPTQIFKPEKTGTARPPRGQIAANGRAS